ncbi:MAG: hypothetical protein M1829_000495 [Trizodia sp. TS-e1964]|nr:MAG: hypothetical protein M1829_000495 [Trizodia sp. TS-e1964]
MFKSFGTLLDKHVKIPNIKSEFDSAQNVGSPRRARVDLLRMTRSKGIAAIGTRVVHISKAIEASGQLLAPLALRMEAAEDGEEAGAVEVVIVGATSDIWCRLGGY